MKFFYFIVIVNVLAVVGIIGFVIWQSFNSGSPLGLIILALILMGFLGFFIYIGVPRTLWRWYIVSTGERVRAVILERRLGGMEMYTGGTEHSQGKLTSQQVVLKLEIHPTNSAVYIVEDRFWVNPAYLIRLSPGSEMQAAVARNNPKCVVAMPETVSVSANASAKASATTAPEPVSMEDIEVVEYLKKGDVLRAIRAHRAIHGSDFEEARMAVTDIKVRLGY